MFAPSRWSRFLRCERGISALEFGFVAPVILLTITGIVDLMMVMFVTSLMEGGLRDASRLGRTGLQPVNMSREEAMTQKIAQATLGLIDMEDVQIETKVYQSFDQIQQPEPFEDDNPANGIYDIGEAFTDVNGNGLWDSDMGATGLGGPGEVVLYQINYDWHLLTPMLPAILGNGGIFSLKASVAVRNEPWEDPNPPLGG